MKILILEDELIISEDIKSMLEDHDYEVCEQAVDYDSAVASLIADQPDLVLLDINLAGNKTGIDVGHYINNHNKVPFIYTSALTDSQSIDKAKQTKPAAYLVKPFKEEQLVAAIEVAMANFTSFVNNETENIPVFNKSIFVKNGDRYLKLALSEILYIQKVDNYLDIHTLENRFTVRATLSGFIDKLGYPNIFKTHKSYAVNLDYLSKLSATEVIIMDKAIPLSKSYAEDLKAKLRIF